MESMCTEIKSERAQISVNAASLGQAGDPPDARIRDGFDIRWLAALE
jgi:hypothetical protein